MMAEMRLIDAGALNLRDRVIMDMGGTCFIEDVETAIDQAPTIDPETLRPVGVWAIEGEDIIWGNSLKRRYCTNCCERPHFDKEKRKFILTPYCPNCGARMKGENE